MSAPVYKTRQRYLKMPKNRVTRSRFPNKPQRLDSNLWYHTYSGRFRDRGPLKRGLEISEEYKKTGRFNNEAKSQDYQEYMPLNLDTVKVTPGRREKDFPKNNILTGSGDRNIFFRRHDQKKLQPILRKRVFKDLEPSSRVIGSLDLTKKEKQATMIVEGVQGVLDMMDNFIRTPKLHPDGRPMLNPLTNKPEFERRTLQEVLAVAYTALMKSLENNNIVPSDNIKQISLTFTQNNVQNILLKFQAIIDNNPGITQAEKKEQFLAAILLERLKDMTKVDEEEVDRAIGQELIDEKEIKLPDNWDEAGQERLFPTRGYRPAQWDNFRNQAFVNAYVARKLVREGSQLITVNRVPITMRQMGSMFSHGHILDLQNLQFIRRADADRAGLNDRHPDAPILVAPALPPRPIGRPPGGVRAPGRVVIQPGHFGGPGDEKADV